MNREEKPSGIVSTGYDQSEWDVETGLSRLRDGMRRLADDPGEAQRVQDIVTAVESTDQTDGLVMRSRHAMIRALGGILLLALGLMSLAATIVVIRLAGSASLPLATLAITCVIGASLLWQRRISRRRLASIQADLAAATEAVQKVVLRPLPSRVGHVRTEARYLAAASEAHAGGDVYSAVATPYGVRLLIGDVMGTGLQAAKTASNVVAAFEQLAVHEPKLAGLALRLNVAMSHSHVDPVTALMMSLPAGDEPAEVVCCGHPPPLLLRGTKASFVDLRPPAPPIGLLDLRQGWCKTTVVPLDTDDQLLMYTNGVSEARDRAGRFYPLRERAGKLHADPDPARFLDALQADLVKHCGGQLRDDAALMLLHRNLVQSRNARTTGG